MTPVDPARAARAAALVIGVGGLGAPAARALAGAGVGRIGLVDPDAVEISNLHRQPLYATADAGRAKVEAAADRLRADRPGLRVETARRRFGAADVALLAGFDVVLDGTDSIADKFVVNDACVAAGVPLVHVGVTGWQALGLTVVPGATACYRCVFEEAPPPGDVPSCTEAGVLGPVAVLAGLLQAEEALRVLAGRPAWADAVVVADLLAGRHRRVAVAPNPRCPACTAARAVPRSEVR
jgi:molybdopterin/thiamine biosynthesis adenylyltransferase